MSNNAGRLTIIQRGRVELDNLVAFLRSVRERGMWPYTPDPAEPGPYTFGEPQPGTPIWLAGNSRHELKGLGQILTPLGVQVLAIDTGGLDLYLALAAGRLTAEMISDALAGEVAVSADGEATAPTLLAFPLWAALYRETPSGAPAPDSGPANTRDLPAFLAGGRKLTAKMKVRSIPLRERASCLLPHAGLLLLITVALMAFIGSWLALRAG